MDGYRLDVQAFRGLAVLLVVLYHARVVAPGGFVGVDVFFVISGFVIGRLLVARLASAGTVSFRSFYERRARRLLPALGFTLVVVSLVTPLLAPIAAGATAARTAVAAALFSANGYLYWVAGGGYFAPSAELNPLLHTWSLSVEEQFYFVVPAALVLIWKVGVRTSNSLRALRVFTVLVVLTSFVACMVFSYADWVGPFSGLRFAFFSPFTRAWEFAAGFVIVLLPQSWFSSKPMRRAAVIGGLGLIALAAFTFSEATVFPGAAALVPVVGSALVIFGGTGPTTNWESSTQRLLGPMVRLGDLSYGWYLWHWPFIVFAGAYWQNAGRLPLVIAAALSLGPAALSHRFLEQRFRVTAATRPASTLVLAATCIFSPLLAVAGAHLIGGKVPDSSVGRERSASHVSNLEGCDEAATATRGPSGCIWGPATSDTAIVLVGDSNAGHFSETLVGAAEATESRLRIESRSGCPFIDAEVMESGGSNRQQACRGFVERMTRELKEQQPDLVLIANSTDLYLEENSRTLVDPSTGKPAESRDEEARIFQAALERTAVSLGQAGIEVAIAEVPPKPRSAGIDLDTNGCSPLLLWTDPDRCSFPDFGATAPLTVQANRVERNAARASGATTWSFAEVLCPQAQCSERSAGFPLWSDGDHLSVGAAKSLVPQTKSYIEQIN